MGGFRPPYLLDEETSASIIRIVSQYIGLAIGDSKPEANQSRFEWSVATSIAIIGYPVATNPVDGITILIQGSDTA